MLIGLEGYCKIPLFLRVGGKLYKDLSFLYISEVFKCPEVQGMLRHSSKVRDRLLHLASSVTMKETQVLEAAYFTAGNTAPIHLLSDTKAESIKWKIK